MGSVYNGINYNSYFPQCISFTAGDIRYYMGSVYNGINYNSYFPLCISFTAVH